MGRGTGVAARASSKMPPVDSDPPTPTKNPVLTARTTRLAARTLAKSTSSKPQLEQVATASVIDGSDDASPQSPSAEPTPADELESSSQLPASEASHAEVKESQPREFPALSTKPKVSLRKDRLWRSSDEEEDNWEPAKESESPTDMEFENEEYKRVLAKFHKKKFIRKHGEADLDKYSQMWDKIDGPKVKSSFNYMMSDTDAVDDHSESEDKQVNQYKAKPKAAAAADAIAARFEVKEQSEVEYEDDSGAEAEAESEAESEGEDQSEVVSENEDQSEVESEDEDQSEVESEEQDETSEDEDERNNVWGILPPAKDLSEEQITQYKAKGHWRWADEGYDYAKDSLFFGNVWPFPREKEICKLIASYLIPEDRVVKIKAIKFLDTVSAAFDHDYPPEDMKTVSDMASALLSWRSMYKCIGGMAFSMLRFEFNKTTAVKALLTGYRKWESTNGLPSVLSNVKTITINDSFGQKFGDWLGDMSQLECIDEEGKVKELDGLKQVVFTGMPSGRSVEDTGTCYMPSSLEKLRALAGKLKKREMQTWVVKKGGVDQERVSVRLIYGRDIEDDEFGVKEDEVLLDPSQEMKAYRQALSRNNANKEMNATRRVSAGLASHSPEKSNGKKRRNVSGSKSRQIKKSPKKEDGTIRHRRTSDEYEAEELNRRVSDVSLEDAAEADEKDITERPIFSKPVLKGYLKLMEDKSQEEKDRIKKALHMMLDLELGDR